MPSTARNGRASSGTNISPVAQLLKRKRPANLARAVRFDSILGKRIRIMFAVYPKSMAVGKRALTSTLGSGSAQGSVLLIRSDWYPGIFVSWQSLPAPRSQPTTDIAPRFRARDTVSATLRVARGKCREMSAFVRSEKNCFSRCNPRTRIDSKVIGPAILTFPLDPAKLGD